MDGRVLYVKGIVVLLLWAEVGLGPVEPVSMRFSASDYIAHSRNPAHHQSYRHSYVAKHDISSPAVGVAIAHISCLIKKDG